jgi:hypothetical protein
MRKAASGATTLPRRALDDEVDGDEHLDERVGR